MQLKSTPLAVFQMQMFLLIMWLNSVAIRIARVWIRQICILASPALSHSMHVKSTTSTVTTNELPISTASDSKTSPNSLVSDPPDIPGAASALPNLFSGATIGKIEGHSFTFNLVADYYFYQSEKIEKTPHNCK